MAAFQCHEHYSSTLQATIAYKYTPHCPIPWHITSVVGSAGTSNVSKNVSITYAWTSMWYCYDNDTSLFSTDLSARGGCNANSYNAKSYANNSYNNIEWLQELCGFDFLKVALSRLVNKFRILSCNIGGSIDRVSSTLNVWMASPQFHHFQGQASQYRLHICHHWRGDGSASLQTGMHLRICPFWSVVPDHEFEGFPGILCTTKKGNHETHQRVWHLTSIA